MRQVSFNNTLCNIVVSLYAVGGGVRWDLRKADDGTPYCTATTNLPEHPLPDGHIHIKNHSENRGLLRALVAAGLVEPLSQYDDAGMVDVPIVKVLHADLLRPT